MAAVALSSALAAMGVVHALRRSAPPLRLLGALAVGYAYLWLSPQAFYALYRVLLDGLPAQWVADLPSIGRWLRTLTFSEEVSLSRLAQGALLWGLVLASLSPGSGRRP